ncbi:unnamed protein product [Callosobruchus maculatus]|uniref:Uncharacterized protein n=1 Tax=Callosobruchus maculatus TaxID=64391 RepID=A0A653BWS8_CALMS|nr:unnamed protein product [Callosobruchus maculatus]
MSVYDTTPSIILYIQRLLDITIKNPVINGPVHIMPPYDTNVVIVFNYKRKTDRSARSEINLKYPMVEAERSTILTASKIYK